MFKMDENEKHLLSIFLRSKLIVSIYFTIALYFLGSKSSPSNRLVNKNTGTNLKKQTTLNQSQTEQLVTVSLSLNITEFLE